MKYKVFILIGLGLLLWNCSNSQPGTVTETATQSDTPTSDTFSVTNVASQNLTDALTDISSSSITRMCIDIRSEAPLQDVAKTGTVVVGVTDDAPLYLSDLQTGVRYDLPFETDGKSIGGIVVSPNGDRLAYIEDIPDQAGYVAMQKIWVVNAKGEVLASQTIKPKVLFSEWQWINNERLQLQVRPETIKDGTVAIVNPFTQEWQYLSAELPNFYTSFELSPVWWLVYYNSSMETVAYLGTVEGYGLGTIVWDVNAQKAIWESPGNAVGFPRWSPSGSEVAVVMNGEIYLVNQNGQVTLLPELGYGNDISEFSWSPNGRYIAFWARHEHGTKANLMVYDIGSNQIIDYCIGADDPYASISAWSTDSERFVVKMYRADVSRELIVLVDKRQNIAYEIPGIMEPLEWMTSIP